MITYGQSIKSAALRRNVTKSPRSRLTDAHPAEELHRVQHAALLWNAFDLWDVTSGDVDKCAPGAVARRSKIGTQIHLDWVLDGRLETPCGLPRPHVVFGNRLSSSSKRTLNRNGYEVVYLQQGQPNGKDFPRGYQLGGYIAVRKNLLTEEEREAGTVTFTWRESHAR